MAVLGRALRHRHEPQHRPSRGLPHRRAGLDLCPSPGGRVQVRRRRADLRGHPDLPAGGRSDRGHPDAHRRGRRGHGGGPAPRAGGPGAQAIRHARSGRDRRPQGLSMEIAPLAIAVPLLGAGLLTAIATRVNRPIAEVVALAATVAVTTFCAILLARTASGTVVYWFGGWHPRGGIAVGVSFAIDAMGAGLATLVSLLMIAALVLMWRYRDTNAPHFQTLMLLFLCGMVGFCLSGDLFNMFVFFELMSVA